MLEDIAIGVGLFGLLLFSLEAGFRAGRRSLDESEASSIGQVGAIQGAVLGLLGLLLAFSFAAAGARFLERQDLIVQEANAIGTAFLRASLLDEPHRTELRGALQRYTEHRVALSAQLREGLPDGALDEVERLQGKIWRAAEEGVTARPVTMLAVLSPVNDVIDMHSTRIAASRKHLPSLVIWLLIACSVVAIAVIGYGSGLGGRRRAPLTVALVALVGTCLWITFDLDLPRSGFLKLSDAPLATLRFESW
ncbi:MAG: hypothetical protein ACF8XB_08355 [Planctomycetota bacterium JB042]